MPISTNTLDDRTLKQLKYTERELMALSTQVFHTRTQSQADSRYTEFLDDDQRMLFALSSMIIGSQWQTVFLYADGTQSYWSHEGFDFDARCLIHDQLVTYLLRRTKAQLAS